MVRRKLCRKQPELPTNAADQLRPSINLPPLLELHQNQLEYDHSRERPVHELVVARTRFGVESTSQLHKQVAPNAAKRCPTLPLASQNNKRRTCPPSPLRLLAAPVSALLVVPEERPIPLAVVPVTVLEQRESDGRRLSSIQIKTNVVRDPIPSTRTNVSPDTGRQEDTTLRRPPPEQRQNTNDRR